MLLITQLLFFILLSTSQFSTFEVWQIKEINDCDKFSACNAYGDCFDFKLIGIQCIEGFSDNDILNVKQTVFIEYDIKRLNQNNHKLVYVYNQELKQINKELIRKGQAIIKTVVPNIRYAHHYYDLQKKLNNKYTLPR